MHQQKFWPVLFLLLFLALFCSLTSILLLVKHFGLLQLSPAWSFHQQYLRVLLALTKLTASGRTDDELLLLPLPETSGFHC